MTTLSALLSKNFEGEPGPTVATINTENDTTSALFPISVASISPGERVKASEGSFSFNAATGALTLSSFIRSGGTNTQFLKADGSVDSSTYITSEHDSVSVETSLDPVISLSIQELGAVDNGLDAVVGWDDSLTSLAYLSAADARTAINVDVAGTDNSTNVSLSIDSDILFSIVSQQLSVDSQTANTILSGTASAPSFRALLYADIPALTYETANAVSTHESTYNHLSYDNISDVTYSNLSTNGDVGTGATQVAQGDHTHAQLHDAITANAETGAILSFSSQQLGLQSQTSNQILCSPDGVLGIPSFRVLLSSEIPPLGFEPAGTLTTHTTTYEHSSYIASSGITYENLNANGDVGTGATQIAQGDHLHTGVYEPANSNLAKYNDVTANFTGTLQNGGSNVLVDSDIGSTVESHDTNIAKTDVSQTWSSQQTFGEVAHTVYNLTGTDIDPANGGIQYKSLGGAVTFTESLASGQWVTLRLTGASTNNPTWPTITWIGGNPTYGTNDVAMLWKENTTLYGLYKST